MVASIFATQQPVFRNPYANTAWALDFKNGRYWDGTQLRTNVADMPGYSYSRSGSKQELAANGTPISFAANAPGIVPGVGFWARQGVTNIQPYSNSTSIQWSLLGGTVTSGQPDPISGSDAGLFVSDGANTAHFLFSAPVAFAASVTYTISRLVKPLGGLSRIQLTSTTNAFTDAVYANFGLTGSGSVLAQGADVIRAGVEVMADGWYRVWLTATSKASVGSGAGTISAMISSDTSLRVAASTITGSFLTTGAQVVTGTVPGPIIVTAGASATVGADSMRFTQPIPVDEDFMLLVVWFPYIAAADERALVISDGSTGNRLAVYKSAPLGALGGFSTAVATTTVVTSSSSQTTPGRVAAVIARRGGKFVGGGKNSAGLVSISAESAAAAFPSSLNQIDIGNQLGSTNFANAPIERIVYMRGTFSDADLYRILQTEDNAWTPASLGSKLILWWDAEDTSSMTLVGSAVSAWTDKSAGFTVSQATSGFRPTWNATALNGRPGVVFDGTDDRMDTGATPSKVPAGTGREYWALVTQNGGSSARRVFRHGAATNTRVAMRVTSGPLAGASVGLGSSDTSFTTSTPPFTGVGLVRLEIATNSASLSLNGGTKATLVTTPAPTNSYFNMGSEFGTSEPWLGAINTIIQTEPLTDDEAAQLLAWLKARGGIT